MGWNAIAQAYKGIEKYVKRQYDWDESNPEVVEATDYCNGMLNLINILRHLNEFANVEVWRQMVQLCIRPPGSDRFLVVGAKPPDYEIWIQDHQYREIDGTRAIVDQERVVAFLIDQMNNL
jgi:hypothetical protein